MGLAGQEIRGVGGCSPEPESQQSLQGLLTLRNKNAGYKNAGYPMDRGWDICTSGLAGLSGLCFGRYLPQSSQLYLRTLFIWLLSPLPRGSGEGSGLTFSQENQRFCADSGADPGGNLLVLSILALSAAVSPQTAQPKSAKGSPAPPGDVHDVRGQFAIRRPRFLDLCSKRPNGYPLKYT